MDLFHEGNIHFIDEDYNLAIKVSEKNYLIAVLGMIFSLRL
jgi:hypothetical protein